MPAVVLFEAAVMLEPGELRPLAVDSERLTAVGGLETVVETEAVGTEPAEEAAGLVAAAVLVELAAAPAAALQSELVAAFSSFSFRC